MVVLVPDALVQAEVPHEAGAKAQQHHDFQHLGALLK
jgi:hypothetical protein